jgi:hypothetical protein
MVGSCAGNKTSSVDLAMEQANSIDAALFLMKS